MLHIICYVAAAVLNLVWLLLGDELHLTHQLAVPVLTVAIAGAGVLLRLRTLPRTAWATICSCCWSCCFSAACSTWTGAGEAP